MVFMGCNSKMLMTLSFTIHTEEHSFITECRFWLLPSCYNNLLNSMPIKYFGRDLLTVFLAKIVHCVKDGEFKHAKSLLEHLKVNTVTFV